MDGFQMKKIANENELRFEINATTKVQRLCALLSSSRRSNFQISIALFEMEIRNTVRI